MRSARLYRTDDRFLGGAVTKKSARLGIVFGLMLALFPSPARAVDDASRVAMEHFRKGTRAYDLGRFLEAANEYEKAYEAKETPALLYNLGQAYRGAEIGRASCRERKKDELT